MLDPLSEARRRGQRFWYRDGLAELVAGSVQCLMSGWLLVSAPGHSRSSWYMPATLLYLLLFVAFAVCASRIMAALRERITYPRSGYVSYGESRQKRRILAAAVLGLVCVAGGLLALCYAVPLAAGGPARWIQWLPAVSGLAMGGLLVYVGVRQGLPRFLMVGVVAIVLGIAVSTEYPLRLAAAIFLAGCGGALLCSGGVTLWKYLRPGPPSACET